jgi:putative acetyltransferase
MRFGKFERRISLMEYGFNYIMSLQEGIHLVEAKELPQIVAVWEASVRATHHFISEADIHYFRPLVQDGARQIEHLRCVRATGGEIVGFIGVASKKIEMLFIHPTWRGRGIGRQLLRDAIDSLGATAVDVNEQNEQAVGFYRHIGFVVQARSELDSTGKPYPILHMALPAKEIL